VSINAGIVEKIGKNVTSSNLAMRCSVERTGPWLNMYASWPIAPLRSNPRNMTFEQAASVSVAAITALQGSTR